MLAVGVLDFLFKKVVINSSVSYLLLLFRRQ